MATLLTRRQVLARLAGGLGLMGIAPLISACGDGGARQGKTSNPAELTFTESDAFYAKLKAHLQEGREVVVSFDGSDRLQDEESRFFKQVLAEAENTAEIQKQLDELDTREGRRTLAQAFNSKLLEHEAVWKPTRVGNDVVDEGTILLVVVTLLATAVTTVIVSQGVRYKGRIELDTGVFRFRFTPVE
ncbi:MAG: hypothetical protein ACOC9P_01455 [bacterium]